MNDADVRRILAKIEPGDYARAQALVHLARDVDLRAALILILEERANPRSPKPKSESTH